LHGFVKQDPENSERRFSALDSNYTAVQLGTLMKAASAVGRDLRISLWRLARA